MASRWRDGCSLFFIFYFIQHTDLGSLNRVVRFFSSLQNTGREADREVPSVAPGALSSSRGPKNVSQVEKMGVQLVILVILSEGWLTMKLLNNQSDLLPFCEVWFLPCAILMSQRSMENLQSSDSNCNSWSWLFQVKVNAENASGTEKIITWEVVSVFL